MGSSLLLAWFFYSFYLLLSAGVPTSWEKYSYCILCSLFVSVFVEHVEAIRRNLFIFSLLPFLA